MKWSVPITPKVAWQVGVLPYYQPIIQLGRQASTLYLQIITEYTAKGLQLCLRRNKGYRPWCECYVEVGVVELCFLLSLSDYSNLTCHCPQPFHHSRWHKRQYWLKAVDTACCFSNCLVVAKYGHNQMVQFCASGHQPWLNKGHFLLL